MVSTLPETTYAVLGLLDKTSTSGSSGYDLAGLADRSLGYFWPISRTLMYRELRRLDSLGWVHSEPVPQDRLPDKRIWSITLAGRSALADWLAQSTVNHNHNRNGFLLKFFLGARMPPHAQLALLADYRESLQFTRDNLAAVADKLAGIPAAQTGRLAALHGLRTAEARLAWIDEVEAELPPAEPADQPPPIRQAPTRPPTASTTDSAPSADGPK